MDIENIQELRKKLINFKKTGSKQVRSILDQLQSQSIPNDIIEKSKIAKTIYHLSKLNPSEEVDSDFTQLDLNFIRNRCKSLLEQYRELIQKPDGRKNSGISQDSGRKSSDDDKINKLSPKSLPIYNNANLIYELDLKLEPNRIKVIDRIISAMIKNLQANPFLKNFNEKNAALICVKLENETFINYKQATQYQNAIKDMLRYLARDGNGLIRERILTGIVNPQKACLLRTEDWDFDKVILIITIQLTEGDHKKMIQ